MPKIEIWYHNPAETDPVHSWLSQATLLNCAVALYDKKGIKSFLTEAYMKSIILLSICLLWCSNSFAAGKVKLYSDLEFSDNSVQQKAVVLPICSNGDVYVHSGGVLACGKVMSIGQGGIVTCVDSACSLSSCTSGYGDCDGDVTNGCETSLWGIPPNSRVASCGGIEFPANLSSDCTNVSFYSGAYFNIFRPSNTSCSNGGKCDGSGVCIPPCGDGLINGTDQCDDRNTANGDGCNSTCQIETGFLCSGEPSTCSTICGDNIKAGAEQCDDGNTAGGDGCNSTCQFETGAGWGTQIQTVDFDSVSNGLAGSFKISIKLNPVGNITDNIYVYVDDTTQTTGTSDLNQDMTNYGSLGLTNPITANIDFSAGWSRSNGISSLIAVKWYGNGSGVDDVTSSLNSNESVLEGIYTIFIPYASIGSGAAAGNAIKVYVFYGAGTELGGIHSAWPMQSTQQVTLMNSTSRDSGSGMTSLDTAATNYILK